MSEMTMQFMDAIKVAGLTPPSAIMADGKLHRFSSNGKPKDDAGWYVFYNGEIPVGAFGDWRTGVKQKWHADIGRELTEQEINANAKRMAAIKKLQDEEEKKGQLEAAAKAAEIMQRAIPASEDFPYLVKKGVKPHGAKIYKGRLVLPMQDLSGKLWNVERISADGSEKKGLFMGKRKGCYFIMGGIKNAEVICIVEGYTTGASIHEATGYPVAVAFSAGNLVPVVEALHDQYPHHRLIVCADDDYQTEGNPGWTKAKQAARLVGALVAVPDFGETRPTGATDFNDLHQLRGLEAVRQAITSLIKSEPLVDPLELPPSTQTVSHEIILSEEGQNVTQIGIFANSTFDGVTGVTRVQASNGAEFAVTPAQESGVTEVTNLIPDANERPVYRVFDEWVEHEGVKFRPGVWYFGIKLGRGKPKPEPGLTQYWVCTPLHVVAMTSDKQQNNFGRLLRFKNTLGHWREWSMPMALLSDRGEVLRAELLSMGVVINTTNNHYLAEYLMRKTTKRQMRCAPQVGWCDGTFILPHTAIGPNASNYICQTGERNADEFTQAGTFEGWQSGISANAIGNPILTLALCASFAGPLLAKVNMASGGIHLVGDSSTGKTTAIEAACATWGGPAFKRSWRVTANGMEAAAALSNDCLLALDEISESDPREVGAIIYALGNGTGKQRATRTGNARPITRWRCLVLSSGERTISTTMAEGGRNAKAGQTVRLLDIPVERTYGAWDDLHEMPSGTAFSDALKQTAATHYGHAGPLFLEKLTRDKRDFCAYLEKFKNLKQFQIEGGGGQDARAVSRFALLALAGELASEYGITGWGSGEATQAAVEGLRLWRSMRNKGNDEREQILEQLAAFIDRFCDGRFSDLTETEDKVRVHDRAGYWRNTSQGREYLFNPAGMREALKGFDFERALHVLVDAGVLPPPGSDGKHAKPQRLGGMKTTRYYCVSYEKLGGRYGD